MIFQHDVVRVNLCIQHGMISNVLLEVVLKPSNEPRTSTYSLGRKQDHLDVEFLIQKPIELSEYSISSSIDLYSCSTTLRYGEADLHINNEITPQAMRIDFVRFWRNSSQTDDSLSHCQSRSSCFQPAKKPDVASCSLQLIGGYHFLWAGGKTKCLTLSSADISAANERWEYSTYGWIQEKITLGSSP